MLTIRKGDVSDLESLMPVMRAAFNPEYGEAWSQVQCTGMLALPGSELFLAILGDLVAGFALVRSILEESELLLIAVDPAHAHCGIGSALLAAVVTDSRKSAVQTLHVEVRADNPALSFYDRHGFVEKGQRSDYYKRKDGGPTHAITLSLDVPHSS